MNENHTSTLVLVVDDDRDVLAAIGEQLQTLGYAVATAGSSKEAMSEIWSRQPDVVLTDIYMPGGDGYELINAIRNFGGEDYAYPNQIGLALSGRLGAAATITKPFMASQLIETIERVIATRNEEEGLAGRAAQTSCPAVADSQFELRLDGIGSPPIHGGCIVDASARFVEVPGSLTLSPWAAGRPWPTTRVSLSRSFPCGSGVRPRAAEGGLLRALTARPKSRSLAQR